MKTLNYITSAERTLSDAFSECWILAMNARDWQWLSYIRHLLACTVAVNGSSTKLKSHRCSRARPASVHLEMGQLSWPRISGRTQCCQTLPPPTYLLVFHHVPSYTHCPGSLKKVCRQWWAWAAARLINGAEENTQAGGRQELGTLCPGPLKPALLQSTGCEPIS